jgi:phosphoribosylformylglycinamidine synthase subunit PurQ / glutaminase
MKVGIVQFPGTNCEYDTQHAFAALGCETQILWHKEDSPSPLTWILVVAAGGFSYGDYLRSGAIAKMSPIMKALKVYAKTEEKYSESVTGFKYSPKPVSFRVR